MSLPQFSAVNAPWVTEDGRLTFAANKFLQQLWERVGGANAWSIDELMSQPANPAGAAVDALSGQLDALRLQSEIAALRDQVSELAKPDDIENQLAQLREQTVAGVYGLRRKRTLNGTITLVPATATNTFTISPALPSVDAADLFFHGVTSAGGGTVSDQAVSIELTNTNTITARRSTTGVSVIVYFRLVEYVWP